MESELRKLKIIFRYPEHDEEEYDIIDDVAVSVEYIYDNKAKTLKVTSGNESVEIYKFNETDVEDDSIAISDILPDTINDLTAVMALVGDYILNSFKQQSAEIDQLNNSIITFDYEETPVPTLTLESGRVVIFPDVKSAYFNISMNELLK